MKGLRKVVFGKKVVESKKFRMKQETVMVLRMKTVLKCNELILW